MSVDGVRVEYSGIRVLHGVSLSVDRGTVEVVLGPNGAGKTTLLRSISGLVRATGGRIVLDGKDISRMRPNKTARLGIQHVQEGKRVFRRLSVDDNLTLGEYRLKGDARKFDRDMIYELFPVLQTKRHLLAGSLSGGEQQMLAISQALLAQPTLLLMDEPSAGLAPILANQMFDVVGRVRDQGLTVLLVEQIVVKSLGISDRGSVLAEGEIVLHRYLRTDLGPRRPSERVLRIPVRRAGHSRRLDLPVLAPAVTGNSHGNSTFPSSHRRNALQSGGPPG